MDLEYFQTSKVLSRKQARCSETISAYDFVIQHLEGSKNPPDGTSRRADYEIGYERPVARLLHQQKTFPSGRNGSVRAVRDSPVADDSVHGANTARRVASRPPMAVSPFLLALSVSYCK